jgi:phosphotransferase system HPr (HPr) family protein
MSGLSDKVPLLNDLSREVTLVNEFGLHARSAAKIARIAKGARARVWVRYGQERADASSTLEVLTLACPRGSRLEFRIEDPGDRSILAALVQLVESGFGE